MQCRDTAHAIGLFDRGTLDVGMKADLNIIDWEKLKINMPYYTDDLPAGAPRWMQTVSGFKRTSTNRINPCAHSKPSVAVRCGCHLECAVYMIADNADMFELMAAVVNGVWTFIDGQHTGALPGGLVRNQYAWKEGVKGVKNTDAVFDDPVRREILANVADVLSDAGETSIESALDRTMSENATGPTHMSRMAREMDKAASREKEQKSKL